MVLQNNINFESFDPQNKFDISKTFDTKFFLGSIKKIKKNIENKKNIFHSFSRNFKNYSPSKLKKYKRFKRIIIIGMGGSILGAQAVNHFFKKKVKKEMIFINNLDNYQINNLKKLKHFKNSLFVIISKSGNTIEVLSIINAIKNVAKFNANNSLIITEDKKSHLSLFAKRYNIRIIFHRKYVGGRYSIFSETALVPCYLMGMNIIKFKKNILNFLNKKKTILIKNLKNLSGIYNSKKINSLVLLNYCEELNYFLLWCQQLIAESLGKKGKGKIPIISIAPRDHHSLLQFYLDGPKDNFFYIFSLKEKTKPKRKKELFKEALNGKNLNEIIENQKDAMISILKSKKIPYLSIEIKERSEETLGELFSYFILETVLMGENLNINPFNQPAVEQLKTLTRKRLFKKIQK
tara:strand:- start:381 stop:1601 length:1221 start_codon:yes stop_codon:yes gene_type:complete